MTWAATRDDPAVAAAARGLPAATRAPDDLEGLAPRLGDAVRRGDRLDAFLFAAGMLQIAEDALYPEPELLLHAARRLGALPGLHARAAATAARTTARTGGALAERRVDERTRRWMGDLAGLVETLADQLSGTGAARPAAAADCAAVLDGVGALPDALRRIPMRRPACFGIFDQHPDDVQELVARFAVAQPARDRPLLVAGVRTSGSYLAPLAAAGLRARGYTDVHVLTLRPERRLGAGERRLVRWMAGRGGVALVCDDPPASGTALAGVAGLLAGQGLDVVLLLGVFGPPSALPRRLADYPAVLLGQGDWAVTARLAPSAVHATVAELLAPGVEVLACERLDQGVRRNPRRNVRAVFRLTVREDGALDSTERQIAVEGIGVGHFGAEALAVHRALEPFLAPVLGVRDGLLYREWLPAHTRADRVDHDPARVAERLAAYVDARARALPLASDPTLAQRGNRPAWEAASLVLSRAFGAAEPVARVLVVDPAVQRLLRVRRPARVDGSMRLSRWFTGTAGELVKVDWADPPGASWRVESSDPVADLAQVSAGARDDALARPLRDAYTMLGHEPVDAERWLLHELAHLWSMERAAPEDPAPRRAATAAVQAYMHEVFFADVEPPGDGPLCAIDVDGVLELDVLGFPALTPASAGALRALTAHGHRPVLCTGRTAPEVIDRCGAYRLAGGVAEYGAQVYVTGAGPARTLLDSGEAQMMRRLADALGALDGVQVDARGHHAVRASRPDGGARPRRLREEDVALALHRAAATGIRAIHGDAQTDLVLRRIDKGAGVRALAAQLGAGGENPAVAFAMGDTLPDVPMLDLATRPFAPAHADRRVRMRARATRRPYTAGFAEAVGDVLGHRPGTCPTCRVPGEPGGRRRLMLALLALRESGLRGLPRRAVRVTRL